MSDWVTWITQDELEPRTKQLQGLPPTFTGGKDTREKLATTAILVIQQKDDGFFLYRYSDDGNPGGDTWHESLGAAQHQANYEFRGALAGWTEVTAGILDPFKFAVALKLQTKNSNS
ncbi:MAG: hypothetical protein ABSF29_09285 [Tepidisphaeraceae bacterium]|jgi:hypothetical protein